METTTRHSTPFPPIVTLGCFFWGLLLWMAASPSAAAQVILDLSASTAEAPMIGDNLYVAWPAAPADSEWTIELVDSGEEVLAKMDVVAKADSGIAPTLLWPFTGIEICEPDELLEAASHQLSHLFVGHLEAAEALAGRTFRVRAVPLKGGVPAAEISFTFAVPQELFFFSDSKGCIRQCFTPDEPTIYLSRWRGTTLQVPLQLFFVQAKSDDAPSLGDSLEEYRPIYQTVPQTFYRDKEAGLDILGPVAEAHALGADEAFWGVVRPSLGSTAYVVEPGDRLVAPPTWLLTATGSSSGSNSGVVVEPWDPCDKGPGDGHP